MFLKREHSQEIINVNLIQVFYLSTATKKECAQNSELVHRPFLIMARVQNEDGLWSAHKTEADRQFYYEQLQQTLLGNKQLMTFAGIYPEPIEKQYPKDTRDYGKRIK